MKNFRIIYAKPARGDLAAIYDHLAESLGNQVAGRVCGRITTDIHSLSYLPERTAPFQKEPWYSRGWRKLIAANHYTVFLSVDTDRAEVYIFRIIFSGMDIQAMLDCETIH